MKRVYWLALLALLTGGAARADQAVALRAGSPGVGLEFYHPLTQRINLRAYAAGLPYDDDLDEAGVSWSRERTLASAGLLADWHPGGGALRFTAGLVFDAGESDLSSPCRPRCAVGGDTIAPADDGARLRGTLDPAGGASYLAIGWVHAPPLARWFWSAEAGVLLRNEPDATLRADGAFVDASTGTPLDDATLDAALAREEDELEAALSDEDLFPVLSLSVGWRF